MLISKPKGFVALVFSAEICAAPETLFDNRDEFIAVLENRMISGAGRGDFSRFFCHSMGIRENCNGLQEQELFFDLLMISSVMKISEVSE